MERLKAADGRPIGVLLNMVPDRPSGGYSSYAAYRGTERSPGFEADTRTLEPAD